MIMLNNEEIQTDREKIMKKTIIGLALLCILCSSCYVNVGTDISAPYYLSKEAAIKAWGETQRSINPFCDWYTDQIEEHERDKPTIIKLCKGSLGCFSGTNIYIWEEFTTKEKLVVAIHEYIHVISNCEYFEQDPTHSTYSFWKEHSGIKSTEYIAKEDVLERFHREFPLEAEQTEDPVIFW